MWVTTSQAYWTASRWCGHQSLCGAADLVSGTRVMTLGDSLRGVIVRVFQDVRVVVRPDVSGGELVALPENLLPETK